jgi:hypothetical protein
MRDYRGILLSPQLGHGDQPSGSSLPLLDNAPRLRVVHVFPSPSGLCFIDIIPLSLRGRMQVGGKPRSGSLPPRPCPSAGRQVGAVVGLGAGLSGGATSLFAAPIVAFIKALQLPKATFVSAVPLYLTAGQIPQLIGLVGFRLITEPRLSLAALACLVSAGGFVAGMHSQQATSHRAFAEIDLGLLSLVGLNLPRIGVLGPW